MYSYLLRIALGVCTILGISTAATGQTHEPLTADSAIDSILDALDARGKTLKDFTADVVLTQANPAVGDENSRKGKIQFQTREANNARVRVNFTEHILGSMDAVNKKIRPEQLEYLLDGQWLTTRDYAKSEQVRTQVARPGEKINLFKLGQGIFPLPIGQSKEDVHQQFAVQKIPPDKEDPPGSVHLLLITNAGTSLARKYKKIDIWVDLKLELPVKIETLDPHEAVDATTQFSNIKLNAGLKDSDFELPSIDNNWNLRDEPLQQ